MGNTKFSGFNIVTNNPVASFNVTCARAGDGIVAREDSTKIIAVDVERLADVSRMFGNKMNNINKEIADEDTFIGSSRQGYQAISSLSCEDAGVIL